MGFEAVYKAMAGVGHLKSVCKDGFRVAGAVQETSPSGMLGQGQGAEFLRGFQVCKDDFTFSWQAQYFQHMEWKNHQTL